MNKCFKHQNLAVIHREEDERVLRETLEREEAEAAAEAAAREARREEVRRYRAHLLAQQRKDAADTSAQVRTHDCLASTRFESTSLRFC